MIGTSLTDDGVELLGQRRGLDAYLTAGKTMGIPILYPWANRLGASNYAVDGAVVTLTAGCLRRARRRTRAANPRRAGGLSRLAGHARVRPTVDRRSWTSAPIRDCWRLPVPARADTEVTLADRTLTIETTVTPTTGVGAVVFRVPPLPDDPGRAARGVEARPLRHAPSARDDNGHPDREPADWNGAAEPWRQAFDDGFDEVPDGAVFALSGGDRRIEVTFEKGYPAAQMFAPASDDVVVHRADGRAHRCTAPRRLPLRVAGEPETARFSITVS